MPTSLAAVEIAKIAVGNNDIQTVSLGATQLWTAVQFVPAGAVLGSSASSGTSYAPVQGWKADTKYPGSAVATNKLVIPAAGKGVTITASIVWGPASSYTFDITMRLTLDGKTIATGSKFTVPTFGSATASVTATDVDVKTGSLIGVEAQGNSMFNSGPAAAASPNSYVRAFLPEGTKRRT
ncbi:hypothetical protein [Nocardia terpenica]|uniref:hypothetical protein n=1 Tax=Nocardia terpenica TaxID=455432 RepID=UPI00031D1F65|nr:hypothetical protein [Nocardia terpenica]NQE86667.1 hypothetical protein [Nocardia terpenica]